MKHLTRMGLATVMALSLFTLCGPSAYAATGFSTVFGEVSPPNIVPKCYAEATDAQTFATASYADLTLATCAFTPSRNDPTGASLQGAGLSTSTTALADQIYVSYSVDGIKATATTGTCAVFVNGAVLARSARTSALFTNNGTLAWSGFVPNTTVGVQTVKVQCKSADTNVFTVNFASLTVMDVMRYPLIN